MFCEFAGSVGMCGAISIPRSACLPTRGADDARAGPYEMYLAWSARRCVSVAKNKKSLTACSRSGGNPAGMIQPSKSNIWASQSIAIGWLSSSIAEKRRPL
ncbi:MAG: hypothetical protein MAG471_00345 [Acidimicrobiaceae bacterium]|nr:hypothetical protein [Acidimicrobiaceae bacterium]